MIKAQTWYIVVRNSIVGWRIVRARRKGHKTAETIPHEVREYMWADATNVLAAGAVEAMVSAKTEPAQGFTCRDLDPITVQIIATDIQFPVVRKPRAIPKHIPAIRSLQDLCDYFDADEPQGLNRRIYKDTDCGASISIETPDGKWHHNGQDWTGITEIRAFTIQTIVEGSDAEVNSDVFDLPVRQSEVKAWMADMEAQADDLWHEANDDHNDDLERGAWFCQKCGAELDATWQYALCEKCGKEPCPHGNRPGACDQCDLEGDRAYDASKGN